MQADRLVGGPDAVLVIDDTALPKKGSHSVGVAPQYASALGKTRQLPDAGLGDAGERRGAGDGGPAAVPAGELDERSGSYGNGTGSGGPPGISQQARDRPRRDRPDESRRRAFRMRAG